MKQRLFKVLSFIKDKYSSYLSKQNLDTLWKESIRGVDLKKLSKEQVNAIQAYWSPLIGGKKVSDKWHQLLYSISGVFNPEYEPFEIAVKVQNALSPVAARRVFDDKCLYQQLLIGFNIPIRVAQCSNGVYYLPEQTSMVETDYCDFINSLKDITDCIIKPSVGTDGGRGVSSLDVKDGIVIGSNNENIRTFIDKFQKRYGLNYCIERKVHECANLQCLNPTSCNTLRIHTYRNREKQIIEHLSSYIRIGKQGEVVDNAFSGGYCGRISKEGYLDRIIRVYPYQISTVTESGVDIRKYKIDNYNKIINTVIKAHSLLPMFDLIGWDVTIDDAGNVIIIEFNPNPDMRLEQLVFDSSCLGVKQADIVRSVFSK